jgi:hypothetical protein
VHVDHSESRKVQHAFRKDLSVSRNHPELRCPTCERLLDLGIAQPRWLKYRDSMLDSRHLGRRVGDLLPAPARAIGLRDHTYDVVGRSNQLFKRGNCKLRRPEEHDAHWLPFARARELLDLADDQIFLQASKPVDEDHAVQVIHLVLEAAREETSCLNGQFLTVAVEPFQHRS